MDLFVVKRFSRSGTSLWVDFYLENGFYYLASQLREWPLRQQSLLLTGNTVICLSRTLPIVFRNQTIMLPIKTASSLRPDHNGWVGWRGWFPILIRQNSFPQTPNLADLECNHKYSYRNARSLYCVELNSWLILVISLLQIGESRMVANGR